MIFLIIGGVLILIGIVLTFVRKKTISKSVDIKYYQTVKVDEVIKNAKQISDELGSGSYSEMVELKGQAICANPLKGEFSGKDCVYYKSEVYREYEVLVEKRDSQGKLTRNWERKNEKVGGTEKSVEFMLKDESGEIPISIEGANKISQKVVDKFEPAASAGGGLSFSFGSFTFSNSSSNRTIGYKKVEYCIPNNSYLYILGEANDRDSKMKISKPLDKKNQFIVSTKSEEELISQFEKSAKILLIISYILVVLGGLSIIYGIYQSIK
ncbi:MAG: hypothetical protein JW866_08680 [Ignavibacteriales bacterium]|nr:hypothetical protein [Ignavibacteriales bacterium]